MPTINIDAEIEMEDIDTGDLVEEIIARIDGKSFSRISDKQKDILRKALGIGKSGLDNYPANNLLDAQKLEDILPNLWKRSPQEIQKFFC